MMNVQLVASQEMRATPFSAAVVVVDDDPDVCDSLKLALGVNHAVTSFGSAEALLGWVRPDRAAIIVCDLNLGEVDGIEALKRMRARNCNQPVIMLTGHGDVGRAVQALKAGACDFLEKPCPIDRLEAAISGALGAATLNADQAMAVVTARQRLAKLSGREAEVLDHLVVGQSNKRIAATLGISHRTVEIYRANVMAKMRVSSLSELVRIALMLRPENLSGVRI